MQRVADWIAEFLHDQGVSDVFLVSGGGAMFLLDGIAQHPKLRAVCTHHEQASAMAATAYSKQRQGIGVGYFSTGCGSTNALTGLLGAWQDSAACVFVSGQVKLKETTRNLGLPIRQFGVQEADIVAIVESITKYAVMISDPADVAYHFEKAVHLATGGRRGPVWLDIPLDVQGATIDETKLRRYDSSTEQKTYREDPSDEEIEAVAEMLAESERPIIIGGNGIRLAGARNEFLSFIEKLQIPVVLTHVSVDLVPTAHPLCVGRIGNKGTRAGNLAVQNADLVVAIGCRLHVSATGHEYDLFAREAKLVVVDIDPIEHKKGTVTIDLFINGDAKKFIAEGKSFKCQDTSSWVEKCARWKEKYPVCLPEYSDSKDGINLYYFVECLSRKMPADATVVSDAGSAGYTCSQGLGIKDEQRYIPSGAQMDMGNALPAAIGASVARGEGQILAVTGDGSFQMNIQELQTLVHYDLPVKLFVLNNDGYLSIRATQRKFFDARFLGTDSTSGVSFPDTEKIAAAYGIRYFRAENAEDLNEVMDSVLAFDGPVICELMCVRDQLIIPTVSAVKREDGTIVSRPIEDMAPFLDREEFYREMIIEPLGE